MPSKLERLRASMSRAREKAAVVAEQVKTDAETLGGAALAAYVRGRYESEPGFGKFADDTDEYTIMGLDPELVFGLPTKALAYANVFGRANDDVQNIVNGALSFYVGMRLYDLGQQHKNEASTSGRVRGRLSENMSAMSASAMSQGVR